jgi:ATP-dependent DNA helicase RecQ
MASVAKLTPTDILKKYWGYDSFRGIQQDVINSTLSRKDTIAFAATGDGKTVMFQVPALLLPGTTLVVSPLKALQKDQVDRCMSLGIPVAALNSDTGVRERKRILKELQDRSLKILYVAPETLFSDGFKPFLELLDVPLIAIDESHVCSSWSDFRPDYRKVHKVREIFPDATMLAVTATADEQIKKDIIKYMGIHNDYNLFVTSFDRPNIHYNVIQATMPTVDHIIRILVKYDKETPGIIYCSSREKTEQLAKFLNMTGYKAISYHAGMKKKEKEKAQEDYLSGEVNIVCATIAFGMGIDKPNIRWVIHADPPNSFDDLAQQWGRASRDGEHADAYLIYNPKTLNSALWLLSKTTSSPERLQIKISKLKEFHAFCRSKTCRRRQVLGYFGEVYDKGNCKSCDICLSK